MNDAMTMTMTTIATTTSSMIRRLERERDALERRLVVAEETLASIERETDVALVEPSIAFLVTRRVSLLARTAAKEGPPRSVHEACAPDVSE